MGFDYFFGYNCQRKAHEYYPEYLWRNDEKVMLDGQTYSHDLMANEALEFVRRNRTGRSSSTCRSPSRTRRCRCPTSGPMPRKPWPENLKTLAAMITRMDGDVGRLMALLKELGLDDQTLVFFASDNGGPYADTLFNHCGPLRGQKRDMYEGGIRTPAIARWPGKINAGRRQRPGLGVLRLPAHDGRADRADDPRRRARTASRSCPSCSRAGPSSIRRSTGSSTSAASTRGRASATGRP